jgi:hypothetical protein
LQLSHDIAKFYSKVVRMVISILDEQSKSGQIMVMTQSPIAEAKKRLCELVDLAEAGETIVILRHGRPQIDADAGEFATVARREAGRS